MYLSERCSFCIPANHLGRYKSSRSTLTLHKKDTLYIAILAAIGSWSERVDHIIQQNGRVKNHVTSTVQNRTMLYVIDGDLPCSQHIPEPLLEIPRIADGNILEPRRVLRQVAMRLQLHLARCELLVLADQRHAESKVELSELVG